MKRWVLVAMTAAFTGATAGATVFAAERSSESATVPIYRVIGRIPIPDGGWDYATVDGGARRLYLARDFGVLALDLDTRKVTGVLVPGSGVHTAVPVGNTGLIVSTNGDKNAATVAEARTGRILGSVATGKMPDAAVYEPSTGLVVVLNHRGGTATLVNAQGPTVVGTVRIGGELESGVADGAGLVYVNVASKHKIAVLDIASRKVTGAIELSGCLQPSGLAYDAADQYLISVCDNGITKIVRVSDRQSVASLRTGHGSDGVIFDADRKLAFVPAGEDGKLSVIGFDEHRIPRIVQTLATQKGTRLGGLDPKTGRLYLPSADFGPPVPPVPWPATVPGSVMLMVVGPR